MSQFHLVLLFRFWVRFSTGLGVELRAAGYQSVCEVWRGVKLLVAVYCMQNGFACYDTVVWFQRSRRGTKRRQPLLSSPCA